MKGYICFLYKWVNILLPFIVQHFFQIFSKIIPLIGQIKHLRENHVSSKYNVTVNVFQRPTVLQIQNYTDITIHF